MATLCNEPCSVRELLEQDPLKMTYDELIVLKERGRDTPVFKFGGKRQCRLNEQYDKWKWMCGSSELKSLFCFPCLVFKQNKKAISWTKYGYKDVANLGQSAAKHARSEEHIHALSSLTLLGKVDIDRQIDSGISASIQRRNNEVTKNRAMLKHHIRAASFLVCQGLAFRGHDESKTSSNRGNYIELIDMYSQFSLDDKVLEALESEKAAFSGLSSDIQNDIISCMYTLLMDEIKLRVQKAKYISLMADESTDIANHSQMAVSIRLLHNGEVHEHLVDVVEVSADKSSDALASAIKSSLKSSVNITESSNVIGQSYDGASNMAGHIHSVQTILKEVWPSADFTHCYAHKWALVVRKACDGINTVSLFFGTIQTLCSFFRASPKRACLLEGVLPGSCATRWLSRGKCVGAIENKFNEIRDVLLNICSNNPSHPATTRAEAHGLLTQLSDIDNVFLLKLFKRIFCLSDAVTTALQHKNLDTNTVSSRVKDYKVSLKQMKSDEVFKSIYDETLALNPNIPRQRTASNRINTMTGYSVATSSELTKEDSLKRIQIEIIDILLTELDTRFHDIEKHAWMILLQPDNFKSLSSEPTRVKRLVVELKTAHPDMVPDTASFIYQLNILYTDSQVKLATEKANDCASLLKLFHSLELSEALPDVYNALSFMLSISLTSVTCERSFSVLRRVKNYCRSTMSQKKTKQLMILSVESALARQQSKDVNFCDKIIDMFADMKDRRIDLKYHH